MNIKYNLTIQLPNNKQLDEHEEKKNLRCLTASYSHKFFVLIVKKKSARVETITNRQEYRLNFRMKFLQKNAE